MKQTVITILSILFGLLFVNSGLNKFFNYMPMPEEMPQEVMDLMGHFMAISWLMPLVAVAEIAGGILVMIPKYRALGGLILFPVMVGIVLVHVINIPDGLILSLVLFAFLLFLLYDNRSKLKPLFA